MQSQDHHRQLLLKAIRKYKRLIWELCFCKSPLTREQVMDTLLARDSVQRFIDEIAAIETLNSQDLAYLDLRRLEIEDLDAMLQHEAPRVLATCSPSELRGDAQRAGWWWYLGELPRP